MNEAKQIGLTRHVARLLRCRRCPRMQSVPVSGGAVMSDVMIIGQAPGPREPTLKRPFAHTAGKTLCRWLEQSCGTDEATVRSKIYFGAVCRCFPGKNSGGTDRVPAPDEIRNCALWMDDEIRILQPRLIIPVGRLAIMQFIDCAKLEGVIGRKFRVVHGGHRFDVSIRSLNSGKAEWENQPRHWLGFSSLRRRSSRRRNASITTRHCKRPRTARITNTSRGSARSRIYLQGSARRRRLLFRKFWRSMRNDLENSLPIWR